jgi:diphosphomevalonate decarboxylase
MLTDTPIDINKASVISRLGSGSASRSVIPHVALWGKHESYGLSNNEFAIDISDSVNSVFKSFHDDILIVSAEEKKVSSTAGHDLMNTNVYADTRYKQANDNITQLKSILASGDVASFGELAESEAMTLHALMMCSSPSYVLMQPHTISVIQKIRNFRNDTHLPIYFTLDAGPNVHILYPDSDKNEIQSFIKSELKTYAHNDMIIEDEVGTGPQKLKID